MHMSVMCQLPVQALRLLMHYAVYMARFEPLQAVTIPSSSNHKRNDQLNPQSNHLKQLAIAKMFGKFGAQVSLAHCVVWHVGASAEGCRYSTPAEGAACAACQLASLP